MEDRNTKFDKKKKVVLNNEILKLLFSLCETMTNIAFDFTEKSLYCKLRNFRENFILANNARHI